MFSKYKKLEKSLKAKETAARKDSDSKAEIQKMYDDLLKSQEKNAKEVKTLKT